MEHKIIVVGAGPGHPDYMLPVARQAVAKARVLVAGRRLLEQYGQPGQQLRVVDADIAGVLGFIAQAVRQCDVVVLVAGDPGYYSLLDALRRQFTTVCLQVIPGLSAMQLAFARVGLPWHGARLLSWHGREPTAAELTYAVGDCLGLLTDSVHNSQSIAVRLQQLGWPADTRLYICARLSYADEQITATTLGTAAVQPPVGHCILLVCDSLRQETLT